MRKQSHIHISKQAVVLLLLFMFVDLTNLKAQQSYNVLFLGNSYTYVNNLPQMVHDVAVSAGDTLIFDSHTPGGYQLVNHNTDATSQSKIMAGGWHYVIVQGQSQEPVVASSQFFGGGIALFNQIKQFNPCAVTMPYMTWGRKNGDASTCPGFPLMCTYQTMDSTLKSRYLSLTESINGEVSPVSVVWNYLRKNYPAIDLYQVDESHPSMAGSYAAACCFYASIFKKDPTAVTFNSGLSSSDATIIKNAVKIVVFDSLQSWNFKKLPVSKFVYQIGSGINQVNFSAISQGVKQNYFWDLGDGATTNSMSPSHSYTADGTYTVTLITSNCDLQGVHTQFSDTVIQFCSHTPSIYISNSYLCNYDTLWTQPANTYQWLWNGTYIPETKQYLANYNQYNISNFTVLSTINGCSELSKTFTKTPEWSGYYFDAIGNPCVGDTVEFAVLHFNGFLSGSEKIRWFKNNVLLSAMNDKDTLLISSSGKYECKVINPAANCPFDTTTSIVEYNCGGTVSIEENNHELFSVVFPNPASETITLYCSDRFKDEIEIYNVVGSLVKVMKILNEEKTISIADLPDGYYFIRLKNTKCVPLKFIKQ